MPNQNGHAPPFHGFSSPNGTIVPDEFFDVLMTQLTDSELRVCLYIIRRTFGFKKSTDDISLRQMVEGITTRDGRRLDNGAGVSKASAVRAVRGLLQKGAIIKQNNRSVERGDEPTTYALRFITDPVSHRETPPRVSPENTPVSQDETHNKQFLQTTDRDFSKFEGSHDEEDTGERTEASSESTETESAVRSNLALTSIRGKSVSLGEILRLRAATRRSSAASDPLLTAADEVPLRRRRRAVENSEEREQLRAFLEDFAIELGDEAPLSSTITRTLNIFTAASVPPEHWGDNLYEARGLTQEHTAQIRKTASGGEEQLRRKNKMPYFLATLEQLVGLCPAPARSASGDSNSS